MINMTKPSGGIAIGVAIASSIISDGHCANNKAKESSAKRPNIILILADDMGLGDISCFNNGATITPNIDQLIRSGVYFNNAYSGSAVSAPARASLLTGLYPQSTNCVTLNPIKFPELTRIKAGVPTMADIFRNNGYATGLVGKWHCGVGEGYTPIDRGFSEFEGFFEGHPGLNVPSYNSYWLTIQKELTKVEGKYLTNDLSGRAIEFINRHKQEPFFLHLAHYAPHRPLGAPEEVVQKYIKQGIDNNTAMVYAMVEIMDRGIGELVTELERLGLRDNTIIIFSSDNGPDPLAGERFNLDMKGSKYKIDEGGIHIPFVVNWHGKLAAGSSQQLIHFADVLPSLVDICKLATGDSIRFDGVSFTENLLDPNATQSDRPLYWQWNRGIPSYTHNAAMRQGNWKLVRPYITRNVPDGESTLKPVLYNLKENPREDKDVANKHKKIYRKMTKSLEVWSQEVEAERIR